MLRTRAARTLAAIGLAGCLLASCSDDQPDTAAATTAPADTTSAVGASFCDGAVGFDSVSSPGGPNDPTPDDMRAYAADALTHVDDIVAGAPADLHDAVSKLQDAIGAAGGGDASILADPGFLAAAQAIERAARDHCDVTRVDLTATEFAFGGIPQSIPAGRPISFQMTNDGGTSHLMLLARAPDANAEGDQAFLDGFLGAAFAGGDAFKEFEQYDVTGAFPFADAGKTDLALKDLEPGTYLYFCPLPVDPDDPSGPSHYQQGMHGRFTVEEH
jgi:hypothetical protein